VIHRQSRGRGIYNETRSDQTDQSGRKKYAITAEVYDKAQKKNIMLVTSYGPTRDEKKEQLLSDLANICSNIKIPTLIGGDFNILIFSGEKNRNFSCNRFTDMFNWIINTFELRDLNLNGGVYTWSNNQEDSTLERLDRVLISPE
jgi:hypothetical protein